MSVEQFRQRRIPRWNKFVNGAPYPTVGWPIGFIKANREIQISQSDNSQLLLVAIGEHEEDVTYCNPAGDLSPDEVVQAVANAQNGIGRLDLSAQTEFADAFDAIAKTPGRSGVDILMMLVDRQDHEQDAMAHFGSRELDFLTPHLGNLALQILPRASELAPADLVRVA